MSAWPSGRRRLALVTLATALLTAVGVAAWGGAVWHAYYAVLYVLLTAAALLSPAAVILQVLAGQALAASLLLQPAGPSPLLMVPIVAAVVLTAELLGSVARLTGPVPRWHAPALLPEIGRSVLVGAGAYVAVALGAALPGPTGLVAVALGAAACSAIALMLLREAR